MYSACSVTFGGVGPFYFFMFSQLHCRCCLFIETSKLLTIFSQLDESRLGSATKAALNLCRFFTCRLKMGRLFFTLSGLSGNDREPDMSDSGSGRVMSYNQMFSLHLLDFYRLHSSTTFQSWSGHSAVPLIEEVLFAVEWSVCLWQGPYFA